MKVFVDTSGIVALLWASDDNHKNAVRVWKRIQARRAKLFTTELVIAESVMLARSRASYELALEVWTRLVSGALNIVWVDSGRLTTAREIFEKYSDHELSLCDCASAAVMRAEKIRLVFGYDGDFETLGFEPLD